MEKNSLYTACALCERRCLVNRTDGIVGYCGMSDKIMICRAALHRWEEPIISGERGSGTVFFSGCSLGCVFCQNREISRGSVGASVSEARLAEIMFSLQNQGAHNINFVTPTHFAPGIINAVKIAREKGLSVPTVYNTGSFDSVETIRFLKDTVNIYLPDFKYFTAKTAKAFSNAEAYPKAAKAAIAEMVSQRPKPIIENGLMSSGVIVRILLLPDRVAEAKLSLKYLYGEYGDDIYISLMNQYTPMQGMKPPLNRRVTHSEYYDLINYAEKLGVKNAFIQEFGTAEESFIPPFDLSGVL